MSQAVELPPRIPGLRFDRVIGRGGMSVVWKAYFEKIDGAVAVKVMNTAAAQSGEDVRRFLLESRVTEELHHPGIVHGYEADKRDGRYYFVMDFVSGYTLAQHFESSGPMTEEDALIVTDSVALALGYAWREKRVVHCDVKPENIMVDGDGTVKLTDLGLCRVAARVASEGKPDHVIGTPAYMSPEQIYGEPPDPRADIYSLGAALYHLATVHMLFDEDDVDLQMRRHCDENESAPDPRAYAPLLSEGFATLLANMCMKDKDARYADWEAVRADSARVQRGEIPERLQGVSSIALGKAAPEEEKTV